jgi:nicotinic acid mononucleotide adenylyltransferase
MHWKIKRDPFYSSLYEKGGMQLVEEGGFFYDTSPGDTDIRESLKILCTPLTYVEMQLKNAKNPCVLLSTGSFSPLHSGHIEMMYLAKERAEEAGYQVLGGYISPGHDEYVLSKVKEDYTIALRIKMAQEALRDHGWLFIDPWEGVFAKVAVNFTDVVYRLEAYLEKYLGEKIPVFFVAGSDNARFSLAFENRGHCVVIDRPGYQQQFEKYREKFSGSDRILFTGRQTESNSSTLLRKSAVPFVNIPSLELRCEHYDERENFVIDLLSRYFENVNVSYFSEEKSRIEEMLSKTRVTVSIDSLFESDYNLRMSRCFDIGGMHSLGYSNRPGFPLIEDQALPNNVDCDIYDDDIHSGKTMKFAEGLLSLEHCNVIEKLSLRKTGSMFTEVLDARDFLVGEKNSGLVVKFPKNTLVRVPYVYPYVSPEIRCSITNPVQFSAEIWKINADYFSKKGTLLKNISYPQPFLLAGFSPEETMENVCQWHFRMLSNLC